VHPVRDSNHFARDAGIDPDDPIAALSAFRGGERRIDVGRVGERVFLNNVSLGAYAHLVHRREHHRRRRQALARVRAFGIALRRPEPLHVRFDGKHRRGAALLVANNEYRLDVASLGERARLDEGVLGLYLLERVLPWRWKVRRGVRFEVDVGLPRLAAAADGEPIELESPFEVRVEPLALRLLQPGG
jgi:diacylglycerol kinase family enzyme